MASPRALVSGVVWYCGLVRKALLEEGSDTRGTREEGQVYLTVFDDTVAHHEINADGSMDLCPVFVKFFFRDALLSRDEGCYPN